MDNFFTRTHNWEDLFLDLTKELNLVTQSSAEDKREAGSLFQSLNSVKSNQISLPTCGRSNLIWYIFSNSCFNDIINRLHHHWFDKLRQLKWNCIQIWNLINFANGKKNTYNSEIAENATSSTNWLVKWAMSWQNLFTLYANIKDTDQPVHLCSLFSVFTVCCLGSKIPTCKFLDTC